MSPRTLALSLYWDNVDDVIVRSQRRVCEHLGLPVQQHRIDSMDHGEWIDWNLGRHEDVDVVLFLDIDCIPLSAARIERNLGVAAEHGTLVGAEGAANHLDPHRTYAGAWYVYVNRHAWKQLGRPSARATPYGDVCQAWTDTWRANGAPVELVAPTAAEQPLWDLPDRPLAYGRGTTYADDAYHLFESRSGNEAAGFVERCEAVLRA